MHWIGEREKLPAYDSIKSIKLVPTITEFNPEFNDYDPIEWDFKVITKIDTKIKQDNWVLG